MVFRFVHTADIHLDSPLRSLSLRDPAAAKAISNATRAAFVRIIDLCLEEKVDALLIAGDLYDGDQTSMKTARFLAQQLYRLEEANIPSFIIRGNHDALSKITVELTLPSSVRIFPGRAGVEIIQTANNQPVAIHGLSFSKPEAPDSLLDKYKPRIDGAVNIGLMHTSLNGALGHDPYAPCSEKALYETGFDYWALGHIHKRFVVSNGETILAMPGIPQGRDVNESGPKSVILGTIDDHGAVNLEERRTSLVQFERVLIDLGSALKWGEHTKLIFNALEKAREAASSEQLATRITLMGNTPIAWRLRHDHDLLLDDVRQQAERIGDLFIEKIETTCAPPKTTTDNDAGDPLGELESIIKLEIAPSLAFRAEIDAMAKDLRRHTPKDHQRLFARNEEEWRAYLEEQTEQGIADVLAALRPAPAGDEE